MKCTKCGEYIEEGNRFCANCGIQIINFEIDPQSLCIRCVINLDTSLKFCPDCGNPIKSKITADNIPSKKNTLGKASAISPNPNEQPLVPLSFEQTADDQSCPIMKKTEPYTKEYKELDSKATSIARSNETSTSPLSSNNTSAAPLKSYETAKRMSWVAGLIVILGVIFFALKPTINDQLTSSITPTTTETNLSSQTVPIREPHKAQSPSLESIADNVANITVIPSQRSEISTNAPVVHESLPSSTSENFSSQALLQFATNGDWQSFQAVIKERKGIQLPPVGDRKLAKSLNDEAMDTLKSDSKRAVDLLTKAYSSDPSNEEIAVNLGLALRVAENYESSEEHFYRIIEIWPDRAIIWFNLARTLSIQGDKNKEAIGALVGSYILSKNKVKTKNYYEQIVSNIKEHELLRTDINIALNTIKLLKIELN